MGEDPESRALSLPVSEHEALDRALGLGDSQSRPVESTVRQWEGTILRLTVEGWKPQEIADMMGVRRGAVTRLQAMPSFLLEVRRLSSMAEGRSVSLRKRIEGMAHQALDQKAKLLGLEVDVNDPKTNKIIDHVSSDILDREGTLPKKTSTEHTETYHLTVEQINEINERAEEIIEADVIEDGDEALGEDGLLGLYEDMEHLVGEEDRVKRLPEVVREGERSETER